MTQNYLWKVMYEYRNNHSWVWEKKSKVFTNKLSALNFANQLENNRNCRCINIKKWFG